MRDMLEPCVKNQNIDDLNLLGDTNKTSICISQERRDRLFPALDSKLAKYSTIASLEPAYAARTRCTVSPI